MYGSKLWLAQASYAPLQVLLAEPEGFIERGMHLGWVDKVGRTIRSHEAPGNVAFNSAMPEPAGGIHSHDASHEVGDSRSYLRIIHQQFYQQSQLALGIAVMSVAPQLIELRRGRCWAAPTWRRAVGLPE
ncbi:hypothetical protein AB0D34_13255 [Streptomyces sp. NPDC048420]|uniref:hypothetical protein n=1 Tax=Streptomyces sp. NPDC048420 TaxID=3155755 RepID=UPI00341B05C5